MNSAEIDKDEKIPEDLLTSLKKMQLFGCIVPRELGLWLFDLSYVAILDYKLGSDKFNDEAGDQRWLD